MDDYPSAGAAEDGAAGEHLGAKGGRLATTRPASRPLKLGEQTPSVR
jgi:hypothetical protein